MIDERNYMSKQTAAPSKPQVAEPPTKTRPHKSPPRPLPPWKVLLHNDDVNDMEYVIDTIVMLTPLDGQEAMIRMLEAHKTGVALLLSIHRERAELYAQQFTSRRLSVTIEPAG
jgi:ATP-dependent Clp protease adaptor protein ClpS